MDEIKTIPAHIAGHASATPDKIAVIADDGRVSYAELENMVLHVAAALEDLGIKKGDRVVSMASHSASYVAVCYGIHRLGAVHVPVENRAPDSRVAEIAASVDASLIISPGDPGCGIPHALAGDLLNYARLSSVPVPAPVFDCAEIIYTTGTTGKSKGVMVSANNLASYVHTVNPTFGMDENTVFLICVPLNHAGGLRRMHMTMAAGGTAVLLDGVRDLKKFFRLVYDCGVNATYLPPASVRLLLTLAKAELAKLDGKLNFIYTASAAFPTADIEALCSIMTKTRLYQGYGGSETGSVANFNYNAPGAPRTCLGHPYNGVTLKLTDDDGNTVTGAGAEGYISVKSPMNMLGYWNEPELTASVLAQDGWVKTSDLGYLDEEGRLFFAGRGDDVIIVGGFKIAPTEVESAALRCESIADCVCTGIQSRMGTSLKLLVVIKAGYEFDPRDIAASLRKSLEPYKVPALIEQIDVVPRTYNGKINRKALR